MDHLHLASKNPVFQVVYISRARDSLCYSDLHEILASSRRRNELHGITGILIYKEGFFVQLLEGEESLVLDLLSRIVRDRRNHHLQVIHETLVAQPYFSKWSMAFRDGDLATADEKEMIDALFEAARDTLRPRLELMTPLEKLAVRVGSPS